MKMVNMPGMRCVAGIKYYPDKTETALGLLGGAIVAEGGMRRNRALLADAEGEIVSSYDKLHVPCETGFWERDHYEPGLALTPPCVSPLRKRALFLCRSTIAWPRENGYIF